MNQHKIIVTAILLAFHLVSFCQFDSVRKNVASIDNFNTEYPAEKIFIHYDRFFYNQGDTMWLKGYILSAQNHDAIDSSGIVYIECINASGVIKKRKSTYCNTGLFAANILLAKNNFETGNYILRAYTNHMRNNGDSIFFESNFTIMDTTTTSTSINDKASKNSNKQGRRRNKITTDTIPKIDLQFLPEGSSFIAGKLQRLGFKAIGINGKGTEVNGVITDNTGKRITNFSSVHKGMGVVWFTPVANEKYTAILSNGDSYSLPAVQSSGTMLQVKMDEATDSIVIKVDASAGLVNTRYFLKGSYSGISWALGIIRIKDEPYRLAVSKKDIPSGISHITLYDSNCIPVNERAILVWKKDTLALHINTSKTIYNVRDSVKVTMQVSDTTGKPVQGSFSMAVIDTSIVPYPTHAENIISYMLLSSGIKGNVEEPAYYFDDPLPEAIEALMLTQGWVKYDQIPTNRLFSYEKAFSIHGAVTNVFNKPMPNANLTLFLKDGSSAPFFSQAIANKQGRFLFDSLPIFFTDSVSMLIKAVNKKGRSFGTGIEPDINELPPYRKVKPANEYLQEEARNTTDASVMEYKKKQEQLSAKIKDQGGMLQEVILKSRTKVKGSKNLNDDGGSDQSILPVTLDSMAKETLLDVLNKKVKGFHYGPIPKSPLLAYKLNGDVIVFVIDGYNIMKYYDPMSPSANEFINYENNYLKYISGEDVAGIEIMSTMKYKNVYEREFNMPSGVLITYTFIEITTYSGNGAFAKKIPGMYLYKPLAPVVAKMFYSPKYHHDSTDATLPDYRTTVYWNPDITTNEKGEATVSFYTSDNSNSSYLITVQGTDMQDGLGVAYKTIFVRKEDIDTKP